MELDLFGPGDDDDDDDVDRSDPAKVLAAFDKANQKNKAVKFKIKAASGSDGKLRVKKAKGSA